MTKSKHELLDVLTQLNEEFGVVLHKSKHIHAEALYTLLKSYPSKLDDRIIATIVDKSTQSLCNDPSYELRWVTYPCFNDEAIDFLGIQVNPEEVRVRYLDMKEIWADVEAQFEQMIKITDENYLLKV